MPKTIGMLNVMQAKGPTGEAFVRFAAAIDTAEVLGHCVTVRVVALEDGRIGWLEAEVPDAR